MPDLFFALIVSCITLSCITLSGCTAQSTALRVPWLDVDDTLVFSDVPVGAPIVLAVPIANTGTAEALVTASIAAAPFSAPAKPLRLLPGEDGEVSVVFVAERHGTFAGALVLDAVSSEYLVHLLVHVQQDADGDGFLAEAAGGDDCDDGDASVFPGAPEQCDGIDQDCDGIVDNPDPLPQFWPDRDNDGFGDGEATALLGCDVPTGYVEDDTDCDDADGGVSPSAVENWYDGRDQNCDGADDYDQDMDGHRSIAFAGDDCDDTNPGRHPGLAEVWYDGVDQDCDGNDDDRDEDGSPGGPSGVDCDDLDPGKAPGLPELDDGIDQDCDGLIDEGLYEHGTLVFSEVQTNPNAVADPDGRYIEVWNPTDGHVELDPLIMRVANQPYAMTGVMDPGSALLLCTNVDFFANGGLVCDDAIPWVGLVRYLEIAFGALLIDQVDWVDWDVNPPGVAMSLGGNRLDPDDNDDEDNWCEAVDPYGGGGDRGTPGAPNPTCP